MTPSGKAARRKERRRYQRADRELARTLRSNLVLSAIALVALVALLSCGLGIEAPWCPPQPFLFLATVVSSAIGGLGLGGTIRVVRERRALERSERG